MFSRSREWTDLSQSYSGTVTGSISSIFHPIPRCSSRAVGTGRFSSGMLGGEQIATSEFVLRTSVNSVCFSPNGELVAAGSDDPDQYLELWNGRTLEHVAFVTWTCRCGPFGRVFTGRQTAGVREFGPHCQIVGRLSQGSVSYAGGTH